MSSVIPKSHEIAIELVKKCEPTKNQGIKMILIQIIQAHKNVDKIRNHIVFLLPFFQVIFESHNLTSNYQLVF